MFYPNHAKIRTMVNDTPEPVLERNPVTHQRHRREVFWQITVPLLVVILLLLALAILVVFQATAVQKSVWADISLMWLIVPALFMAIILMIIFGASAYLCILLIGELPIYFRQAHVWLEYIGYQIAQISDKAVAPVLRIQSFNASMSQLGRQFLRK